MPKPKLVVGVTGGRSYQDYYTVQKALAKVASKFDITVVGHEAGNVTDWARIWCERARFRFVEYGYMAPQLLLAFAGAHEETLQSALMNNIPIKNIPERVTNESAGSV